MSRIWDPPTLPNREGLVWIGELLKPTKVIDSNPHVSDPEKRKSAVEKFVRESTAIEKGAQ
jgi:hypothetical protein